MQQENNRLTNTNAKTGNSDTISRCEARRLLLDSLQTKNYNHAEMEQALSELNEVLHAGRYEELLGIDIMLKRAVRTNE